MHVLAYYSFFYDNSSALACLSMVAALYLFLRLNKSINNPVFVCLFLSVFESERHHACMHQHHTGRSLRLLYIHAYNKPHSVVEQLLLSDMFVDNKKKRSRRGAIREGDKHAPRAYTPHTRTCFCLGLLFVHVSLCVRTRTTQDLKKKSEKIHK